MIRVNEIFYSIQGESSYSGFPCVFIRLSGCNLRCGYCDTEHVYSEGEHFSLEDILNKVRKYKCHLVEITGGEPLLQDETNFLINRLVKEGFEVLVETNGTMDISKVNKGAVVIMDIKCPSSGESSNIMWKNIVRLKDKDEIKFVIGDKKDYDWAKGIIDKHELHNKIVLFSPVYNKLESNILASWILADKINVRLQPQLHKMFNLK